MQAMSRRPGTKARKKVFFEFMLFLREGVNTVVKILSDRDARNFKRKSEDL